MQIIPKLRSFNAADLTFVQRRNRLNAIFSKLELLKSILEQKEKEAMHFRERSGGSAELQAPVVQPHSLNEESPYKGSLPFIRHDIGSTNTSSPVSYSSSSRIPVQPSRLSSTQQPTDSARNSSAGSSLQVSEDHVQSILQAKVDNLLNKSSKPSRPDKATTPISCIEVHDTLSKKAQKVLFFDVRPIEEYISGHISWLSILKNKPGINGGVINIEPEWVDRIKSAEELEMLLGSFGSANVEQKELFANRANMDLVIFYDAMNRSSSQSSEVSNAIISLFPGDTQKVRFLSGGFRAWQLFVKSDSKIAEGDWIEIGDGTGMNSHDRPKQAYLPHSLVTKRELSSLKTSDGSRSSMNYRTSQTSIPPRTSSISKYSVDSQFGNPFRAFGAQQNYQSLQKSQLLDPQNTSQGPSKLAENNQGFDELRRFSDIKLSNPIQYVYPSLRSTPSSPKPQRNPQSMPAYNPIMDNKLYLSSPPFLPPNPQLQYNPVQHSSTPVEQTSSPGISLSRPLLPPKPSISSTESVQVGPPLPPKPSSGSGTKYSRNSPLVMSPISFKLGFSGLRNLGNTCFMNSILQCVTATTPLTRYFLGGHHRRHIAKSNPLSSGGRVVESFTKILQEMVSGESTVCVPTQFKNVIGEMHPVFGGNEQQDSQEFLSFILDQLHEDLNIARRPFPENGPEIDSEDYSDRELLKMESQKYFARNWSIIIDMFQGILKSRLQCLKCGKVLIFKLDINNLQPIHVLDATNTSTKQNGSKEWASYSC